MVHLKVHCKSTILQFLKKALQFWVHWVELPDLANKVQVMRHSFIRCSSEINFKYLNYVSLIN